MSSSKEVIYVSSRSASPAVACTITKATQSDTKAEEETTQNYYFLQEEPHRVYANYRKSRQAWFNRQPVGASLTDRAYRESAKLPLEYDSNWYRWCREYNQMGPFVKSENSKRLRDWTVEELNSWVDAEIKANDAADEREKELLAAEGFGYAGRQGGAGEIISRIMRGGDLLLPPK